MRSIEGVGEGEMEGVVVIICGVHHGSFEGMGHGIVTTACLACP